MSELRVSSWSLGQIARVMGGELVGGRTKPSSPTEVTTDTRELRSGALFVALVGERFDGHDFLATAAEGGACAVVISEAGRAPEGCPAIVVGDTLRALSDLGSALFLEAQQEGLHSVAVTGSNGKTTTKEILKALWGARGAVWATPGNLNNHIGVPLTLCGLPRRCDHLILEMGANHVGEIEQLIALAPTDERIITSIGKAHLEGFGSLMGVRRGKGEILGSSDRATVAIVPAEEAEHLVGEEFSGRVVRVGEEIKVEWDGLEMRGEEALSRFIVEVDSRKWTLSLPLVGRHNAGNLGAALATIFVHDGAPAEAALNQALANLEVPGGRLRFLRIDELEILDDAYNANPSSMRASFEAFARWSTTAEKPAVAVIGEMKELGEVALQEHRDLARWLVAQGVLDGLVFVGEFADEMAEAAAGADGAPLDLRALATLEEAQDWLRGVASARVFLKGSRANRLERIPQGLLQESDAGRT